MRKLLCAVVGLEMKGSHVKEEGPQFSSHKELESANNLNEAESRILLRASRKEPSPALDSCSEALNRKFN